MKCVTLIIAATLSCPLLGMFKGTDKDSLVQLYRAVNKSDKEALSALLQNDISLANCSFRELRIKRCDETGERETPLLCAIKDTKTDEQKTCDTIFMLLLNAGAEVDKSAQNGLTPLLKALLFQREDYVVELLTRDANTYAPINIQGRYVDALELAKHMKLTESYKRILEHRRSTHKI